MKNNNNRCTMYYKVPKFLDSSKICCSNPKIPGKGQYWESISLISSNNIFLEALDAYRDLPLVTECTYHQLPMASSVADGTIGDQLTQNDNW